MFKKGENVQRTPAGGGKPSGDYCHKVATCYLNSVFLQTATAEHLLQKFQEGMSSLSVAKLLQITMDGPNVKSPFSEKTKKSKPNLEVKEKGGKID